jgi:hypothetical protein
MGCVTALPGSHRLGQLRHSIHSRRRQPPVKRPAGGDGRGRGRAVPLVLRAGECSLHHTHLLAQLGAEPRTRPPHRRGHQLHPHAGAARRSPSPHRVARARRGPSRALRPGACPRADFDAEARAATRRPARRFFGSHGSCAHEVAEA